MKKLFVVGVDRFPDQCVVQRIDMEKGIYLMPKTFKESSYYTWVGQVADLILKEAPEKIVFDEFGMGAAFKGHLLKHLRNMISEDGTVVY